MFQAERACRPGFPGSPHCERRGTFSASIAGPTCLQLVFDGLSGHGGHFNATFHEMVSHCDTQVNHSNNPAKHAPKRQLPGCPLRWAIRPGPVREQNLQLQPRPAQLLRLHPISTHQLKKRGHIPTRIYKSYSRSA